MPTATTITTTDALALAIAAAREADAAYKAASEARAAARADLLALLQAEGLSKVETEAGTAQVIAGRRTVEITCKALKAEIKLMQERAVRTGRAVEKIGSPYVKVG